MAKDIPISNTLYPNFGAITGRKGGLLKSYMHGYT
jgi:hypothetical protein